MATHLVQLHFLLLIVGSTHLSVVLIIVSRHKFSIQAKDYGNTGRPQYVNAIMPIIDWTEVERRIDALEQGKVVSRQF